MFRKFLTFLGVIFLGLLLLAFVAVLLYVFVAQPFKIKGSSMKPAFSDGQYYLVNKKYGEIKRGDVVVFKHPTVGDRVSIPYISRVIGLPNESILLKGGKIYINSLELDESSYLNGNFPTIGDNFLIEGEELKTPSDSYFVLGDTRAHSLDSRIFGFVPKENIVGKIWFCYAGCN